MYKCSAGVQNDCVKLSINTSHRNIWWVPTETSGVSPQKHLVGLGLMCGDKGGNTQYQTTQVLTREP